MFQGNYSYEALDKMLHHKTSGKPIQSRKVGNNTSLERRTFAVPAIAVRLHSTDVVTFMRNGTIVLDTGGWYTVTTKDRMNKWLPAPFGIFSRNSSWQVVLSWETEYVHSGYGHEHVSETGDLHFYCYERKNVDRSVPYFDGMILDPKTGTVVNTEKIPDEKARDKRNAEMRRKIKNYVALYTDERIKELLEKGSAGDCFFCMQTPDNTSLGDAMDDDEHLLLHMKERYLMLSMLYHATSNRGNPWAVMQIAPDVARHDLSKYLRKRLLEATMVNH